MSPKARGPHSDHLSSPKGARPGQVRLDLILVERGLAPSRERAQALLLAGHVRVNGAPATKAGVRVAPDARIELIGKPLRYASRAGLKLEGALEDLGVNVQAKICLDVGSSNGGFTDCLLQHGARKVYAVDVTIDQLAWKLQQDTRVARVERNARYLRREDIGEGVERIVVDVSFISVCKVLPALAPLAEPAADFLILIKPQFELERGEVGKGGIVREPALHQKSIDRVKGAAMEAGLEIVAVRASRVAGAEGNQEFFLHARRRE